MATPNGMKKQAWESAENEVLIQATLRAETYSDSAHTGQRSDSGGSTQNQHGRDNDVGRQTAIAPALFSTLASLDKQHTRTRKP
jgi:hypothetical protein